RKVDHEAPLRGTERPPADCISRRRHIKMPQREVREVSDFSLRIIKCRAEGWNGGPTHSTPRRQRDDCLYPNLWILIIERFDEGIQDLLIAKIPKSQEVDRRPAYITIGIAHARQEHGDSCSAQA